MLEEAGGVYVKLGQIAATRVDLIPPEVVRGAADAAEPGGTRSRSSVIRPALEAELGGTVDEVFAEFDWEPLAAASIGQTYRARLRTGEAVVVKVQRPGIADVIERDLAALALARRTSPSGARRSVRGSGRARCSRSSRRACGPSSTSGARPTR